MSGEAPPRDVVTGADARRATSLPEPFAHLPVLDGLRTLAVVPVVLFHADEGFPGGFIGVDLFFVISGFLITSILLRERESTGRIVLPAFWARRFRRLVPAVAVLVAVCALVAAAVGTGSALAFVDSIGALTWTQNWAHLWASQTGWGLTAPPSAIDHLWSLAVEEQFYLVWPLVLLAICRVAPRRGARIAIVCGLIAASAAVMGALDPVAAYFRSDARALEMLGGAVLAISAWRPTRRVASVLGAIGVVAIVVYTFLGSPTDAWMYPWGFLASTAVFAGLVAATTTPPGWMLAVFSAPVQAVGRVSYGIYLWHLPVIRFLTPERTHLSAVPLAVVRLAVLAGVVVASYRFVEMPIRTGAWRLTPLRLAVSAVVVALCLVPLGLDARADWRDQYDVAGAPPDAPAGAVRVLVVGDEVATRAAEGYPPESTWDISRWQCGLLPGDVRQGGEVIDLDDGCDHWQERFTDALDRYDPGLVVVASSTWDLFQRDDGSWAVTDADRRTYQDIADLLGSRGADVSWLEPAAEPSSDVSAAEQERRERRAEDLAGVVRSLHGVTAEPAI